MIVRAVFLVMAVALGLLSIGGLSYGLSPRSNSDGILLYFGMMITTVTATIVFAWLAFRRRTDRK